MICLPLRSLPPGLLYRTVNFLTFKFSVLIVLISFHRCTPKPRISVLYSNQDAKFKKWYFFNWNRWEGFLNDLSLSHLLLLSNRMQLPQICAEVKRNLYTRLNSFLLWQQSEIFFFSWLINATESCHHLLILLSAGSIRNWCEGAVYQCSHQRDLAHRQALRGSCALGTLPTGTRKSTAKWV